MILKDMINKMRERENWRTDTRYEWLKERKRERERETKIFIIDMHI